MIQGLGNDIIEIERIKQVLERYEQRFLDRILTLAEQNYCLKHQESVVHIAGRFAAKEAIVKALGTGIGDEVGWTDIEILNDSLGKPVVRLSPSLMTKFGHPRLHLSISHSRQFAAAVAIWEG